MSQSALADRMSQASGSVGVASWGDLVDDPSISVDLWAAPPLHEVGSDELDILEGTDLEVLDD